MKEIPLDDFSENTIDLKIKRRELLPLWYKIIQAGICVFACLILVDIGPSFLQRFSRLLNDGASFNFVDAIQILFSICIVGLAAAAIGILYGNSWAIKTGLGFSALFILISLLARLYRNSSIFLFDDYTIIPSIFCFYLQYSYSKLKKAWTDPLTVKSPF